MIHSTKGIVLRTIKYGETSVIASIFTELFGVQSYIVNGVRTQSKNPKAQFFQPSSLLEMQVYHSDIKNLQRIKEMKWLYLYKNVLSDVPKNGVALYMVELLYKCLKQPETNADLFNFCEDSFLELDVCKNEIAANFPVFFAMQLAHFFGFGLLDNYSGSNNIFDLHNGSFTSNDSTQEDLVAPEVSKHISELLKARLPSELAEIKLNKNIRRVILSVIERYYAWHIPEFGKMKTLPVLQEILS
ncbi:MAG: DNA repair protein RecO [Ginsengibacter sp.]